MNTLQGLLIPANFWEPLLSLDHSLSSPQLLKSFSPFVPLSINPPPPVPLPQAVLLVSQSLQKFLTGTQSSPWLGDQEHTFRWWSMKKHPKCASLTRVISCFFTSLVTRIVSWFLYLSASQLCTALQQAPSVGSSPAYASPGRSLVNSCLLRGAWAPAWLNFHRNPSLCS